MTSPPRRRRPEPYISYHPVGVVNQEWLDLRNRLRSGQSHAAGDHPGRRVCCHRRRGQIVTNHECAGSRPGTTPADFTPRSDTATKRMRGQLLTITRPHRPSVQLTGELHVPVHLVRTVCKHFTPPRCRLDGARPDEGSLFLSLSTIRSYASAAVQATKRAISGAT